MSTSKAVQRIEEQMRGLAPGTLRYEALEAARRFKSSWIELGRILWAVYREKRFKEWGYLTFEAYCAKEIGVRSATAKKLLHSYYFLEKEEPTLLKRLSGEPPAQHPHVDAVNTLRLLRNRQGIPPSQYQRIREEVLEKGQEPTQVRREVRTLLDAAQGDPEQARAARRRAAVRRMIGTLKALRLELAASHLAPQKILTEIDGLARKLEQLLGDS